MLSSDSPGTLSLSAKITKLSSDSPGSRCQSHYNNLSHNQTQISHATQLSVSQLSHWHLFLTLTTTVKNSIAYIYHIYHTALGHRYFNLAVSCGICLRYAHASHKSASAFRLPNLWDGHGTSLWCLVGSHSDEHLQATAKAIPREQAKSVPAERHSSLSLIQ